MATDPADDAPNMPCPECGDDMRLVGIERDSEDSAVHILTFECSRGHIATSKFPN
jgi:hypothetical protein